VIAACLWPRYKIFLLMSSLGLPCQPILGLRARRAGMTTKVTLTTRMSKSIWKGKSLASVYSSAISKWTWIKIFTVLVLHAWPWRSPMQLFQLTQSPSSILPLVWEPTHLRHNHAWIYILPFKWAPNMASPSLTELPLFGESHVPANSKYIISTSRRFNEANWYPQNDFLMRRRCCGHLSAAFGCLCHLRDREHQEPTALGINLLIWA
jgi:hypothetical protein